MILQLFTTAIGRLRLVGFLEGISLLVLISIAVPLKYQYADPTLTKVMGPIHGVLFLSYVFNALSVGVAQRWKFRQTTWKVMLACLIPFGTFYIDKKLLRKAAGQAT